MYLSRRQTLALVALITPALLGLAVLVWRAFRREKVAVSDPNAGVEFGNDDAGERRAAVVHVCGAVKNPGVYTLPSGSRIFEAIEKAGGALPGADLEALNLAAFLRDGEQIRVPLKGEAPRIPPGRASSSSLSSSTTTGPGGTAAAKPAARFPLNINTASAGDLEAAPGIGPSLAARIVDYRGANGPFASLDDLLNVPGIGRKTLDKLRPYLTAP